MKTQLNESPDGRPWQSLIIHWHQTWHATRGKWLFLMPHLPQLLVPDHGGLQGNKACLPASRCMTPCPSLYCWHPVLGQGFHCFSRLVSIPDIPLVMHGPTDTLKWSLRRWGANVQGTTPNHYVDDSFWNDPQVIRCKAPNTTSA